MKGSDPLSSKSETLSRKIKAGQAMKALTSEELAIKMHMSRTKLYDLIKYPTRIKVEELEQFEEVLGICLLDVNVKM